MIEPPRECTPDASTTRTVKLPAVFQQYFDALREKTLFVTSLDRRVAQIYLSRFGRKNEEFFEAHREFAKIANSVAFNAADLGAETVVDGQGRVLFSPELRRALELEGRDCTCTRTAAGSSTERRDI